MIKNTIALGPFSIHLYGLIVSAAIFFAYLLVIFRAKIYQVSRNTIDTLFLLILPFGIIGARLYHVLDYFDYYRQNPLEILYIWQGGLGIFGALIFGLLTVYFYAKFKNISVLTLLDLASPAVSLGQSIGRWGNYINIEAFGPPTNLAWGISVPENLRPLEYASYSKFHPAFLYESVATLLIFIFLIIISKSVIKKPGAVFALYLILYSISRLIIESFRIDTWEILNIKVAQIISLSLFFAGSFLFLTIIKSKLKTNES